MSRYKSSALFVIPAIFLIGLVLATPNQAVVPNPAADRAVAKALAGTITPFNGQPTFLSGANPGLPEDAIFGLLSSHAGHHVAQINEVSSGDFHDEAATRHAMRKHMLVIADAISAALAEQFPNRFQERS